MYRHGDRTEDLEDPRRKNMPAEDLENIDSELDDDDDDFDDEIEIRVAELSPQVTWGTTPAMVVGVDGVVPAPDGFADPQAVPRLPQSKAELMAGRIPLDQQHAVTPDGLHEVVIGPLTAAEIGWRR